MGDPRVNKYRSSKRPEQQVITSHNDDGSLTVVVADMAQGRIVSHNFPGHEPVDQGPDKGLQEGE